MYWIISFVHFVFIALEMLRIDLIRWRIDGVIFRLKLLFSGHVNKPINQIKFPCFKQKAITFTPFSVRI